MQTPDLVQYQRLASGYVPGASEAFANSAAAPSLPPASGVFQNCTVVRPAGVANAAGVFDILVGPPQTAPTNQTSLRSIDGPAPVGLGGAVVTAPPLKAALAPSEIVVSQGRFRAMVRSALAQPPAATFLPVTFTVAYGATFLAVSPYPGFSVNQIIRVFLSSVNAVADIALTDADFDFDVERVIDGAKEP